MGDKRDGWYEITAADAGKLLDGRPANRPLSEHRAGQIAAVIAENRWQPNGESIVLAEDGKVLDGQHRLRGCQIAGKPIISYVVHVKTRATKVFDTIDTGWGRTAGHRFAAEGISLYNLKAAICRMFSFYDRCRTGTMHSYKADHEAELRLYRSKQPGVDFAAEIVSQHKSLRGLIPGSMIGFILAKASEAGQRDKALAFVNAVATGENLSASNPALQYRNRLMSDRKLSSQYGRRDRLALCIKAWCMYRDRKTAKILKWAGGANEQFPSLGDEE
jgi:hypothetical protein